MKVYIGNYPKKSDKPRKINVRIDKWDTWGMDCTLAHIILPMLKQLKETKHGIPSSMKELQYDSNSVQYSFEFYKEDDDKSFKEAETSWNSLMDEMIWAFSQLVDNNGEWESQFHSGETDFVWVPLDKQGNEIESEQDAELFRMDKGPKDTHVFDAEGYMKHLKRMQEGFELFGKHYMDLWD